MGILKRALLSILRQPVKSLILLVTVAILGTLIAGAVSVKQGLIATQQSMQNKIKITAKVTITDATYQSLTPEQLVQIQPLDSATVDKITALPQVKSYEQVIQSILFTSKLISKAVGTGTGNSLMLQLYGVNKGQLLDYAAGNVTLASGRWLTAEDENSDIYPIVVSDDFAKENHLSLGASLTFDLKTIDSAKIAGKGSSFQDFFTKVGEASFTLVGTYRMAEEYVLMPGGALQSTATSSDPVVYTSMNAARKVEELRGEKADELNHTSRSMAVAPTFTLWVKDRQSVDAFTAAVDALGLPKEYGAVLSTQAYDNTLAPVKNLDWIVNLILAASVAATLAVLGLVISLSLRGRKVEIGILFSLGEQKKRIAAQMVAEVLIIAVLGISIAAFAGTAFSKGIAQQMVKNGVENTISSLDSNSNNNQSYDATALHDMSEGVDITLGGDTIALIYVIGLLTAGASAALPVYLTLRQKPTDILTAA